MTELQQQIENLKTKIVSGYVVAITVDEGWYQLVIDCDSELVTIDPNYKIFQIKEKFGQLRYYMSPSPTTTTEQRNIMFEITRKYEEISSRTCEATGKPGILMKSSRGWLRTLNPEFAATKSYYAKYVPALTCGFENLTGEQEVEI